MLFTPQHCKETENVPACQTGITSMCSAILIDCTASRREVLTIALFAADAQCLAICCLLIGNRSAAVAAPCHL
jgi:hypothetical protein